MTFSLPEVHDMINVSVMVLFIFGWVKMVWEGWDCEIFLFLKKVFL